MARKETAEARTGQKLLNREPASFPGRIVPFFAVVIPLPEFSGHYFIGKNPQDAIANAKRELALRNPEKACELVLENPDLTKATSWKEPIFDH